MAPRRNGSASGHSAATATASSSSRSPALIDAEAVAREVLRRGDSGQYEAVLGVLGDDPGTGAAAARKAFLRISMLIHPDKLPGFSEATRAFQTLITALDLTQKQALAPEPAAAGRPRGPALTRSSEDCFRTEVLCPRCKVPWGLPSEGNPDYYYNFMMQGLRSFTCSTCLTSFGCLTATHKCPWCKESFEYSPDVYHKKVICGNLGCKKQFGFTMYHASENALRAARQQAQEELSARVRAAEAKQGRAARAARRAGGAGGEEDARRIAEAAFANGLRDSCPRCGLELSSFEDGVQLRHLRDCKDGPAQRAHRERERKRAEAAELADKQAAAQLSLASGAVWSFSGGRPEQLWMLSDEQLQKLCVQEGLPRRGSRDALIGRLAEHFAARSGGSACKEALPDNLHALSDTKLSAVCAAFRLKGHFESREDRIEALEELAAQGSAKPRASALTSATKKQALGGRAKVAPLAIEDKKVVGKAERRTAAKAKAKAKSTSKVVLPVKNMSMKAFPKSKVLARKRPAGSG